MGEELLRVENLKRYFPMGFGNMVKAVDGISFSIQKGEIFGLVGESGSGKSTTGRTIAGIYSPTDGTITLDGECISNPTLAKKKRREIRRKVQMVFQDPHAAMSPRMTVEEIVAEPLVIQKLCAGKKQREERVKELLEAVGLDEFLLRRYPSELSGGQQQRVCIARALATKPELMIADEPIASLDVSIQAQIVNLFKKLQQERQLSCLFIAHDLSMVRYLSNRVGVLYHGRLVEIATPEELFHNPVHPYTKALISAIPVPNPDCKQERLVFLPESECFLNVQMREVSPGHFACVPI